MLLKSYHMNDVLLVKQVIDNYVHPPWLAKYKDMIFQICDELLKNALKSNYKFLLLWELAYDYVSKKEPNLTEEEVNTWLREMFYSSESSLIKKNLDKMEVGGNINKELILLLRLESMLSRPKSEEKFKHKLLSSPELSPLLKIKNLANKHNVYMHFDLEDSGQEIIISIRNDSPILESDVARINDMRAKFADYYKQGRPEYFFRENIDNSGGGHGLGYALMDSILIQMGLEPTKSLYLVPTDRTTVILVLPTKEISTS